MKERKKLKSVYIRSKHNISIALLIIRIFFFFIFMKRKFKFSFVLFDERNVATRHISDQNATNLLLQPTAVTFYYLLLKEKVGRLPSIYLSITTRWQKQLKKPTRKILNFLQLLAVFSYNIFVFVWVFHLLRRTPK